MSTPSNLLTVSFSREEKASIQQLPICTFEKYTHIEDHDVIISSDSPFAIKP